MTRGTPLVLVLFVLAPAAGTVVVLDAVGHGWTPLAGEGNGGLPSGASAPLATYRLLIAVVVILLAAHLLGGLARRLGQPTVIGQMVAGILLGPSALGALAPGVQHWLLPDSATVPVEALAQLGVVFFAFKIGYELSPAHLARSGHVPLLLGSAGVVTPMLIGVVTALLLPAEYRPAGVGGGPFALFLGIALCVTAFPVLAGILRECGVLRSPVGSLALATAGVADVVAWCLLACATALVQGGTPLGALRSAVLTVLFVLLMFLVVRPGLHWLFGRRARREQSDDRAGGPGRAAHIMLVQTPVLCAAAVSDAIGVHAIFGAFVAGLIIPRLPEVGTVAERTDGVVSWLLLPMFFASVGLRTGIGLMEGVRDWLWCVLLVLLAVVGKLAGTALPARLLRIEWRRSVQLGVMMSCRGLTELVILDIGLRLGLVSPRLFAMLVVMTLVTTTITTPLLRRLGVGQSGEEPGPSDTAPPPGSRIHRAGRL